MALRHIQSPTSSKIMPLKHHQSSHFIPQDTPTKTHASRKHNTSLKFHAPHPSKHCSISTTQIPCTKFPPAHGPLQHHSPKPLPSITSAHKHDSLRFNPFKIGNHQSSPLPRYHPPKPNIFQYHKPQLSRYYASPVRYFLHSLVQSRYAKLF